jgi:hypothetical protein
MLVTPLICFWRCNTRQSYATEQMANPLCHAKNGTWSHPARPSGDTIASAAGVTKGTDSEQPSHKCVLRCN